MRVQGNDARVRRTNNGRRRNGKKKGKQREDVKERGM